MLRNSCPYTIYPIFSSPPIEHLTSLSTTSSHPRTAIKICPHSFLTPCSPRTELCSNIRYAFLFHLSRPDPFHSSTDPSVRWSPFSLSYDFLFRFRSCSASATQHRSIGPFPLSASYDSLSRFLIGSAKW